MIYWKKAKKPENQSIMQNVKEKNNNNNIKGKNNNI